MDWLTQGWPLILVAGAFGWMMLRRGGQGGGCCGGASEPDSRKPGEQRSAPERVEQRR